MCFMGLYILMSVVCFQKDCYWAVYKTSEELSSGERQLLESLKQLFLQDTLLPEFHRR